MSPGVAWAWLSCWAIGAALVLLGWPREHWRRDGVLIPGLGLAAGLGLTSVVYTASSFLPSEQRLLATALIEGMALLGLGLALRRKSDARPFAPVERAAPSPAPRGELTWLACFVVVQAAVVASVVAYRMYQADPHGGWDAWAIWNLQARVFFRTEGDWPEVMQHAQLAWAHGDYPRAVPASVARLWMWAGAEPAGIAAGVSASFAGATVLIVGGVIASLRSPLVAWVSVFILISLPGFVLAAPNAHADLPLGCFFAGAGASALLGWQTPAARGPLVLAGLMTGLAAWTKNEGLLFCVVFTAVCATQAWRLGRARSGGGFALGLAIALVPTVLHKVLWAPSNDVMTGIGSRGWEQVTDLSRHVMIGSAFLRDAVGFTGWAYALYPVMLLACLAPPWRARLRAGEGSMLPVVGLMALGYYTVFLISPHDLRWHLDSALVRLFLQLAPLAIIGWALLLPRLPKRPTAKPRVRKRVVLAFVALNAAVATVVFATLSGQLRRGELAAETLAGTRVVAALAGDSWHGTESDGRARWTWSRGTADVLLHAERAGAVVTLSFDTRSLQPRAIRVTTEGRELWRGDAGTEFTTVELPPLVLGAGVTTLRIETNAPAVAESSDPTARALAFVVHEARLN